jgi:hypothetical protein
MKKYYLLLLCAVLFLSCSKDDDSASNSVLNPPEWLYGNWKHEKSIDGYVYSSMSIEVSSDNIKLISGSSTSVLDIGNHIRNMQNDPNGSASIEELANNEESYEFTLRIFVQEAEVQRTTYRFVRDDGESIMFYQGSSTGLEFFKI